MKKLSILTGGMGLSPRIFLPERKENRGKSRDFRDLQAGPDRHKKLKNGTPARACGEKKQMLYSFHT